MHQQPRHPPRTAASANNPQTNPTRTNNPRDPSRNTLSPTTMSHNDRYYEEDESHNVEISPRATDLEDKDRSTLMVQQLFYKAGLVIIGSRKPLSRSYNHKGEVRQNKWFNIVLDESDVLQQRDLLEWRRLTPMEYPPPLCIEIYLDLADLGNRQTLVLTDERGKRWDVAEMLDSVTSPGESIPARRSTQVILERWTIGAKESSSTDPLPNVYKKAVVLFRALFTFVHLLPAFKYHKKVMQQPRQSNGHARLKLHYRVSNAEFKHPRKDTLRTPLCDSPEPVVEVHKFDPLNSPVGPFSISVTHRSNCDFRVDDAEALLSSHFMGLDDNYFRPSIPGARNDTATAPGSLPVNRTNVQDDPDRSMAYGSLSTFHQVGPAAGSSPISALRAAQEMPSGSPVESELSRRQNTTQRADPERKSSLRSAEGTGRRPSVSFQPFKAGSLSSSPAMGTPVPPSPVSSVARATNIPPAHTRNRTSLTALPQTALRTPSLPNETAIASSASSSPKPAPITRYSSSFGHRRSKFSSGGGSKLEDDNVSSGRASVSSAQPSSSIVNEAEGTSSGSVQTDDENISDFLKLLEQKKDLRSFNRRDSASREASMRRTTAALSRYQHMRESNTAGALSDSMSSSLLLHRSSSSSSRQLSSVPPMIAGTSVSTSSSPGKPISPHTPHTPAIPSRLSANSIAEYDQPRRIPSRGRDAPRPQATSAMHLEEGAEASEDALHPGAATRAAIDIPTSPRAWPYARRSSSATQQDRTIDDELDIYRSASVPAEDRPDLSLSELLNVGSGNAGRDSASAANPDPEEGRDSSQDVSQTASHESGTEARGGTAIRSRAGHGRGAVSRTSRYSFSHARGGLGQDDDEPLLFAMSELGAASRRSVEEGRGGGSSGTSRDGRLSRGSSSRSPWP